MASRELRSVRTQRCSGCGILYTVLERLCTVRGIRDRHGTTAGIHKSWFDLKDSGSSYCFSKFWCPINDMCITGYAQQVVASFLCGWCWNPLGDNTASGHTRPTSPLRIGGIVARSIIGQCCPNVLADHSLCASGRSQAFVDIVFPTADCCDGLCRRD